MFTGLVEEVGTLQRSERVAGGLRLEIGAPRLAPELRTGESVAVNGVCLTVTRHSADRWWADLSEETVRRSTFGAARSGAHLNLERALQLGGRLGGHLVQGHVDAVALVTEARHQSGWLNLAFKIPENLGEYVVEKGSVAVNGVSLTVATLDGLDAEIAIIPQTLEATNLSSLAPGDGFNFEVDILGKYVARMLARRGGTAPADRGQKGGGMVDEQMLADHGFL
jgi:riboflavin synthase